MNKHAVFYGPHDTSMDAKKRLTVPMELKRCIEAERDGETMFAIVGGNTKVWLFTERGYLEQAEQSVNLMPGKNEIAYNQLMYGTARNIKFDPQGRLRVPDRLLDRTKTGLSVTLVGSKDHIEIWNREDWLAREEELEAMRDQIVEMKATQMPPRT